METATTSFNTFVMTAQSIIYIFRSYSNLSHLYFIEEIQKSSHSQEITVHEMCVFLFVSIPMHLPLIKVLYNLHKSS